MADDRHRSSSGHADRRAGERVARLFDVGDRPREELRAYGRHLRTRTPRGSHASPGAPAGRPDIVDRISGPRSGTSGEWLPVRIGRLLRSPLALFRGTPEIMAADLAGTACTGINVQANGDAHLMNFGVFTSRARELVCDMIDFDQTQPAPWEWDVKRLAASFVLAAQEAGLPAEDARSAAQAAVRHYRGTIASLSTETSLEIHYGHLKIDDILPSLGPAKKREVGQGKSSESTKATAYVASYERLAQSDGGRLRLALEPPLVLALDDDVKRGAARAVEEYRRSLATDTQHLLSQYRFVDAARLVVGESDVGLEAILVLLQGRGDPDPLFLQIKRATTSALAPFAGHTGYARYGQRLVTGQRLTQAVGDPFLGWLRSDDGDLSIRRLRDSRVTREPQPRLGWFLAWARLCGSTLARAHARSVDPAVLSGYLGGSDRFDAAITSFAGAYAEQTLSDYDALRRAARQGRIEADQEDRDV